MKTQSIGTLIKDRNKKGNDSTITRGAVYRFLINNKKYEMVRPLKFITKHTDYPACELWEVRLINQKIRKHLWLDTSELIC
jgi:hypothetical protein